MKTKPDCEHVVGARGSNGGSDGSWARSSGSDAIELDSDVDTAHDGWCADERKDLARAVLDLTAQLAAVTKERDEAERVLDDACIPVPSFPERSGMSELACRVSLLRARCISLTVEREALRAEVERLKALVAERYEEAEECHAAIGDAVQTKRPTIAGLRAQLAACREALREACEIAARVISDVQILPSADSERIAELGLVAWR